MLTQTGIQIWKYAHTRAETSTSTLFDRNRLLPRMISILRACTRQTNGKTAFHCRFSCRRSGTRCGTNRPNQHLLWFFFLFHCEFTICWEVQRELTSVKCVTAEMVYKHWKQYPEPETVDLCSEVLWPKSFSFCLPSFLSFFFFFFFNNENLIYLVNETESITLSRLSCRLHFSANMHSKSWVRFLRLH